MQTHSRTPAAEILHRNITALDNCDLDAPPDQPCAAEDLLPGWMN